MTIEQSHICDTIIKVSKNILNKEILSIYSFENVTNNHVFKLTTQGKDYIFKIYNSGWPENGKLSFVNNRLNENKIAHAELIAFTRDDEKFSNGYLIEECLVGTTADMLQLSKEETLELFKKLAKLVSQVHKIKLTGYGYIGSGNPQYKTFSEFMYDVLKDNIASIAAGGFMETTELEEINKSIYARLKQCDKFRPALCHGDLSAKNILVNMDEITLIDWDDAQSLCWVADIARLTLWMKLNYDNDTADACRKAFLDNYETNYDKNDFYEAEKALHVWYGLDWLTFFAGTPIEEKVVALLHETRSNSGI